MFSPDGTRVLFTRYDGLANPRLTSVDARTGGDPRDITVAGGGQLFGSTYSPDGRRVALAINSILFTVRTDGTELTRRTITPGRAATWIGDGASLIYVGLATPSPLESRTAMLRLPLTGGATDGTPILAPVGNDEQPRWRPDGLLEPLRPITDTLPPVASLLDGVTSALPVPTAGRASAARGPVLGAREARLDLGRMANLSYLATDPGGLRRVELALTRRLPGGGCRALGGDGRLGERRSCPAVRWVRPRGTAQWRTWMRRLERGTYKVRIRATDRRGRRTERPTVVTVRDR